MKNRVLHIMIADKKFNLPLVEYISDNLNLENHSFLILNLEELWSGMPNERVTILKHPIKKSLFSNFLKFFVTVNRADIIIAHAAPLAFFFFFVPWKIRKVIWPIHGGIDIPASNKSRNVLEYLNLRFKRKIKFHMTHIQEDSDQVNSVLSTRAQFLYSPVYLSNVVNIIKDDSDFIYNKGFRNSTVLVGNSTDPSNYNIEAFEAIVESGASPKNVFSILSYGIYTDYKEKVIKKGRELFNDGFKPITEFMNLKEYLILLDSMDYVVFNHKRQQGMGATIQLLSLAKPIFFNIESPAYKSFKRRGYMVFNLNELKEFQNIESLDLRVNRDLLMKDYSIDVLRKFYTNL